MLQKVIDAFRADRLRAAEYFERVLNIEKSVLQPSDEDVPDRLRHRELATSFFRNIHSILEQATDSDAARDISADASTGINEIIEKGRIVNWIYNTDVQNRMRQNIEDFLFELADKHGFDLTFEQIDLVMDRCIEIAKVRRP